MKRVILILIILFPSFLFSATCIKEWQYVGTPGFSIKGGGFVSLFVDDGIPYVSYQGRSK